MSHNLIFFIVAENINVSLFDQWLASTRQECKQGKTRDVARAITALQYC